MAGGSAGPEAQLPAAGANPESVGSVGEELLRLYDRREGGLLMLSNASTMLRSLARPLICALLMLVAAAPAVAEIGHAREFSQCLSCHAEEAEAGQTSAPDDQRGGPRPPKAHCSFSHCASLLGSPLSGERAPVRPAAALHATLDDREPASVVARGHHRPPRS